MRDDEARAEQSNAPTPPFNVPSDGRLSFAALSAYLDDPSDFAPAERTRIELYLATAEGTARVAEVRLLAGGLRELPQLEPPRSFRLTPEQVELPRPLVLRETSHWYARHGAALRWATAAAALLFVLVVSADLITHGVQPSGSDDEAQPLTSASDTSTSAGGAAEATATSAAVSAAESEPEATQGEAAPTEVADAQLPLEDATEESVPPPAPTPAPAGTGEVTEGLSSTEAATEDEEAADGQDGTARNSTEAQPTLASEPTPQTEQAMLEDSDDFDATADAEVVALAEAGEQESSSSRLSWRAVEFSIVVVFVVLLALLVILPRWGSRRT